MEPRWQLGGAPGRGTGSFGTGRRRRRSYKGVQRDEQTLAREEFSPGQRKARLEGGRWDLRRRPVLRIKNRLEASALVQEWRMGQGVALGRGPPAESEGTDRSDLAV